MDKDQLNTLWIKCVCVYMCVKRQYVEVKKQRQIKFKNLIYLCVSNNLYLNLTAVSTNPLYFLNCLNAGEVLMTKMWEPPGGESGEKTFRYRLTYSSCSLNSRFMRSSYFKVPENKGKLI